MKDAPDKKEEQEQEDPQQEEEQVEIKQELSQVATNPKQSALILVGIVIVFGYIFFTFFLSSDKSEKTEQVRVPEKVSSPTQNIDVDVPSIPTLPTPPKLENLEPPPPLPGENNIADNQIDQPEQPPLPEGVALPTTPVAGAPGLPTTRSPNDPANRRQEQKRKAAVMLIAGTPQKSADQIREEADFNYRGDMNLILGRGKIIEAIVESALSTDFGGKVRGVIMKDVYSEWGNNILIPKGSRVFGEYTTSIDDLYGRINVIWTRIDLLNGYSVNFNSDTVDNLGRTGQAGRLDTKIRERLANAVLRSAFNITLAKALDKVVEPQLESGIANDRRTQATSIRTSITTATNQNPALSPEAQIQSICSASLNAFTQKTTDEFVRANNACTTAQTQGGNTTPQQRLSNLITELNLVADNLLVSTTSGVDETQAQKASKESYEDIANTIKSFVEEQNYKPTVTIDQGTPIRIYVNKDYKFPRRAIYNRRGS